ncbi:hypothetical protein C7M84_019315 [Penaeus vannamei]|uniref:Uncharacterized protein n=1 Tax=Penaeus vannamei TaxID=6689 RepID=A0A423SF30_PENVA|nr:hypothetical protein C7M84_019315 [Penaeus vannamei]
MLTTLLTHAVTPFPLFLLHLRNPARSLTSPLILLTPPSLLSLPPLTTSFPSTPLTPVLSSSSLPPLHSLPVLLCLLNTLPPCPNTFLRPSKYTPFSSLQIQLPSSLTPSIHTHLPLPSYFIQKDPFLSPQPLNTLPSYLSFSYTPFSPFNTLPHLPSIHLFLPRLTIHLPLLPPIHSFPLPPNTPSSPFLSIQGAPTFPFHVPQSTLPLFLHPPAHTPSNTLSLSTSFLSSFSSFFSLLALLLHFPPPFLPLTPTLQTISQLPPLPIPFLFLLPYSSISHLSSLSLLPFKFYLHFFSPCPFNTHPFYTSPVQSHLPSSSLYFHNFTLSLFLARRRFRQIHLLPHSLQIHLSSTPPSSQYTPLFPFPLFSLITSFPSSFPPSIPPFPPLLIHSPPPSLSFNLPHLLPSLSLPLPPSFHIHPPPSSLPSIPLFLPPLPSLPYTLASLHPFIHTPPPLP